MTTIRAGSATHVGQVRQVNQDRVLLGEQWWLVADGMGGHLGGEVAAEVAVSTVGDHLATAGQADLVEAIKVANAAVIDRARADRELSGMGTTITALTLVTGDEADGSADRLLVANVGDSRTYLLPAVVGSDNDANGGDTLVQLSQDHSLVATLERHGQLTAAEAAVHPRRNIITRALGVDTDVVVDMWELTPVSGDRYLLCSDGLTNEVADETIAAVLRTIDDPAQAAQELVRLANDAGGRDNITVAVVDVVDAAVTGMSGGATVRIVDSVVTDDLVPTDPDDTGVPSDTGSDADDGPGGDDSVDPPPQQPAPEQPAAPAIRTRTFTWRVALFIAALIGLLGVSAAAVGYYARATYFVAPGGPNDSVVVVYQGRPGGFLWFEPTVAESTDLRVADLGAVARSRVTDGHVEPTLDAARRYVATLGEQVAEQPATSPTTTRPTTTLPATTLPATTSPPDR